MELFLFIVIIGIAYIAGSVIVFGVKSRGAKKTFDSAFVLPAGLALISYVLYGIGSASLLYRHVVIAMLIVIGLIFSISLLSRKRAVFARWKVFDNYEKILFLLILFFPLVTLLGALAPAIGTDSLSYHLGIPKKFIFQHKIGFIPYTMNSLYPFFMEMLFTLGILLKSAVLSKLFHWGTGILLGFCVYSFVEKVSNRKTGLLATLLVLSSPGIFNEMVYAYVDVGLSLYITLSIFSLVLWMYREDRSPRYLLFSGLFLGVSLSIKYIAFYAAVPMVVVFLFYIIRRRKEIDIAKTLALFFAPCVGVSFFWYLKSYLILGDPVFPAFSEFFHTPIKFGVKRHFQMGLGKNIFAFFMLPWNLAINPSVFGGRGSQIGVQYSVLLPFLYFGFRSKERWFRCLAFIVIIYTGIWFLLVQVDRFLYPVIPLYAVILSYSINILFSQKIRMKRLFVNSAVLLIAGTTLFNMAICIFHNRHNYKVTLGLEDRDTYLERWVTNYRMAQFVNKHLPQDSKILGINIYKIYYFDRWIVRENIFQMWEGYREKYRTSEEMKEFLKNKGFTHIIYNNIDKRPFPEYVLRITKSTPLIYSYGPVTNIETGWRERFFLYKL